MPRLNGHTRGTAAPDGRNMPLPGVKSVPKSRPRERICSRFRAEVTDLIPQTPEREGFWSLVDGLEVGGQHGADAPIVPESPALSGTGRRLAIDLARTITETALPRTVAVYALDALGLEPSNAPRPVAAAIAPAAGPRSFTERAAAGFVGRRASPPCLQGSARPARKRETWKCPRGIGLSVRHDRAAP